MQAFVWWREEAEATREAGQAELHTPAETAAERWRARARNAQTQRGTSHHSTTRRDADEVQ